MGFPGGLGCNLSVGSVARRVKRTGRDYLGRWMQDANNDEGRRTNDVCLFVHSSHSVDRMSPSVLNSFGVQNRGGAVTSLGKQKVACNYKTCQFVMRIRGINTNYFVL